MTQRPGGARDLYGSELQVGAMVGPYVLEELRHRGTHAVLYLARHEASGQPAAVKVLDGAFASSPRLLRRFEREVQTLETLDHPHIVRIVEHGALRDGRPFLAMEWLSGRDLAQLLQAEGALSVAEVVGVAQPIAAALDAAHRAGIVHRDLKLQNVMAERGDLRLEVKLVDFGLAKPLARGEGFGLTSTGAVLGTPVAMAPEQVRGEQADAATDLYAFGVLLYQLLTGRAPFEAPTAVELEELQLHATPPPPSGLVEVPAAVESLVLRCLEKRRELRPPSAAALAAGLRAAIAGGGRPNQLGLSLLVELRFVTPEPDDADLDEAQGMLTVCSQACEGLGLRISVRGAGLLLAVRELPAEADESLQLRRSILLGARALAAQLAGKPGTARRVEVSLQLHAGPLGSLSKTGEWAAEAFREGLALTRPAQEGLSI